MSSIAIDATAAAAFVQVFDAADFAGDLGPRTTCTEADTIAEMLRALGSVQLVPLDFVL